MSLAILTLAILTMAVLTMATLCQVVSAVDSADDRFLDAAATADGAALRRALRDGARVDATDARKAPYRTAVVSIRTAIVSTAIVQPW